MSARETISGRGAFNRSSLKLAVAPFGESATTLMPVGEPSPQFSTCVSFALSSAFLKRT
jgi:hypothetical protein